MNDLRKSVDETVQNYLVPVNFCETTYEKERKLDSVRVRSGGLGIPLFSEKACNEL